MHVNMFFWNKLLFSRFICTFIKLIFVNYFLNISNNIFNLKVLKIFFDFILLLHAKNWIFNLILIFTI